MSRKRHDILGSVLWVVVPAIMIAIVLVIGALITNWIANTDLPLWAKIMLLK